MEITPEDKLQFLKEKDDIRKICNEIFDLHDDFRNNKTEIFKRISQVLNHASSISNYSGSKDDVNDLQRHVYDIEDLWDTEGTDELIRSCIRDFCNKANSVLIPEKKGSWFSKIFMQFKEISLIKIVFSLFGK